jgi:hypothetical protein
MIGYSRLKVAFALSAIVLRKRSNIYTWIMITSLRR